MFEVAVVMARGEFTFLMAASETLLPAASLAVEKKPQHRGVLSTGSPLFDVCGRVYGPIHPSDWRSLMVSFAQES